MKSFKDQLAEIKNSLILLPREATVLSENNADTSSKELVIDEITYKFCPVCDCKLRPDHFSRHMDFQHKIKPTSTKDMASNGKDEEGEIVRCPTCSVKVRQKNLKRHIRKLHQSPKKTESLPRTKRGIMTGSRVRKNRTLSPEYSQAMLAKINQGRYDNETQLLNLLRNATDRRENKIINAVHQRLKIVAPEEYRKLVGPLHIRDPLGIKKCYCGNPRSLSQIADEIIAGSIAEYSLLCDACWEEDICSAWGYYGAWGAKIIDTETWRSICEARGNTKYATY